MSLPDEREEPREPVTNRGRILAAFDRDELSRICTMPERRFARAFGMRRVKVNRPTPKWRSGTAVQAAPRVGACPDDFYAFRDNGASVLAVAHLDTVVWPVERMCDFAETADGTVVHSGALDDRLGAYVILDMLPKLGINVDVLLTTGEESGRSTAEFFEPPDGKEYNWIIEFDRGGTDVVMYQYDSRDMDEIVRASGARVGNGSFTDICYLDHLGVKAFNWGVGYQQYHTVRGYAYLEDLFEMLNFFMRFHAEWGELRLEHDPKDRKSGRNWRTQSGSYFGKGSSRRHGRGGGWPAPSSSRSWWDDRDDKKKDDKEKEQMSSLASVLDDIEGPGPMVLAGDANGEIEVVSLDQMVEELGTDELLNRLGGDAPQWGDSLTTDPSDPDFVSPA